MNEEAFDAFICHAALPGDRIIAGRLKLELEKYKIPGNISRMNARSYCRSVFTDPGQASDVPPEQSVLDALQKSRFLIVLCSPELVKSARAMYILDYFWQLKKGNGILTMLIGGSPEESFPDLVRKAVKSVWSEERQEYEEQLYEIEPLAADISAPVLQEAFKLLKTERLRLLAPMLGCTFDDLRRRHYHSAMQKMTILFAATAFIGVFIFISLYSFIKDVEKKEQTVLAEEAQARVKTEEVGRLEELSTYSVTRLYTDVLDELERSQDKPEAKDKILEMMKTRTSKDYKAMDNGSAERANDVYATCSELAQTLSYLRVHKRAEEYGKLLASFELLFEEEFDFVSYYAELGKAFMDNGMNLYIVYVCADQEPFQDGRPALKRGDIILAIEGQTFEDINQFGDLVNRYREYSEFSNNPTVTVTYINAQNGEEEQTTVDLLKLTWILL